MLDAGTHAPGSKPGTKPVARPLIIMNHKTKGLDVLFIQNGKQIMDAPDD